jgi:hypothetical protein
MKDMGFDAYAAALELSAVAPFQEEYGLAMPM